MRLLDSGVTLAEGTDPALDAPQYHPPFPDGAGRAQTLQVPEQAEALPPLVLHGEVLRIDAHDYRAPLACYRLDARYRTVARRPESDRTAQPVHARVFPPFPPRSWP